MRKLITLVGITLAMLFFVGATATASTLTDLQVLVDTGLLLKFNSQDVDYNQAYVAPDIWHRLDYNTKKGVSRTIAKYCDEQGSTFRVTIYDYYTHKKLAKYSRSYGFKVY